MHSSDGKKRYRWGYAALGFLCLFFSAHAATLQTQVPQESATIGSIITIPVVLFTDEPANAVSATVAFPDFLQPLSVTTVGSPISLWIVPPGVDASANTVTAEGIILGEGVSGQATIFSVQVRVTRAGEGYVTFKKASVLARDGFGTNLLGGIENEQRFVASISPDGVTALPVAETVVDTDPVAPVITRYSSRIKNLEDFFVEGKTYGDARVHIAISIDNITEQHEVMSDRTGNFRFTYPRAEASERQSLYDMRENFSAAVFTVVGLEYEFWVWAEKDGVVTPETTVLGVAVEGFSWSSLSAVLDPTSLLIIVFALLGFIVTILFGLMIVRALKKKEEQAP